MQDENLSESLSQIWKSKSDETQRDRDNAYIGQKMQFLSKNQAKVGKFIFNTCCYRISNVFRSHKFHGGMHIWICWNLFQFMLSKLIQDWENLAFFPNTHKCEPLRLLNPHNMWIDVYLLSGRNGKLILSSDHICTQIQMKLWVGFQGSEGFHLSSIKFQTRYEKSMLGQIGEGVDSSSAKYRRK